MILAPYDPRWAERFRELRAVYFHALGSLVSAIEHIGSTAVPGLRAKPILDIDLVVDDRASLAETIQALERLGYVHGGDQGIPQRDVFKRRDDMAPYTNPRRTWMPHHLYVCSRSSRELERHRLFRNALQLDRALRSEYEALKLSIELRSADDRKVYASIKEAEARPFVQRVLRNFRSD